MKEIKTDEVPASMSPYFRRNDVGSTVYIWSQNHFYGQIQNSVEENIQSGTIRTLTKVKESLAVIGTSLAATVLSIGLDQTEDDHGSKNDVYEETLSEQYMGRIAVTAIELLIDIDEEIGILSLREE